VLEIDQRQVINKFRLASYYNCCGAGAGTKNAIEVDVLTQMRGGTAMDDK
jgi:hypothetical protein